MSTIIRKGGIKERIIYNSDINKLPNRILGLTLIAIMGIAAASFFLAPVVNNLIKSN